MLRPHVQPELEALSRLGRSLVILTDPDERGRELRSHLDAVLAPLLAAARPPGRLLHAFVPEASAMQASDADSAMHSAGNRGIEHAVPQVLLVALRAAAPSYGPGRAEWDLRRLQELRLARPFDGGGALSSDGDEIAGRGGRGGSAPSSSLGGGSGGGRRKGDEPRERRRRLCALLGLGRCSGSQLVAALNKYFDEGRVAAALAELDRGDSA